MGSRLQSYLPVASVSEDSVALQGPRVAQIALQGAIFFTLFEAWKAQLKPSPLRLKEDRLMGPKLWRKRRDHVWKRQFVIE